MNYVEKQDQSIVLLNVETDDPNADPKTDEVLKTVEKAWEQVIRADRRSKFQSWRRLKLQGAAYTERERNRVVTQLLRRFYSDQKSRPWVGRIARRAITLLSSLERNGLPVEMARWSNEMNSKLVQCWCQEYFEEHPGAVLDFRKTKRSKPFKDVRAWDDPIVHNLDFLNHICTKLRDHASAKPDAPYVSASLRIQECDPLKIALEVSKSDVVMCADVPLNPGEKWLKILPDYWKVKDPRHSRTLVFPSRDFDSAIDLCLSDQDFRNLPGYIPMLEWQRKMLKLRLCRAP